MKLDFSFSGSNSLLLKKKQNSETLGEGVHLIISSAGVRVQSSGMLLSPTWPLLFLSLTCRSSRYAKALHIFHVALFG